MTGREKPTHDELAALVDFQEHPVSPLSAASRFWQRAGERYTVDVSLFSIALNQLWQVEAQIRLPDATMKLIAFGGDLKALIRRVETVASWVAKGGDDATV